VEQAILNFIHNLYSAIQWPGVILLMAIESACIPIPSEIIMPLAGWMLIKNLGHPWPFNLLAGVYGALGCLLGSIVAYAVGMWGGRPLLNRYGKYVLIAQHDLDRADRWFNKNGDWSIFVTRLLPIIRTFISLPAGIARMNFWKFCLYTSIGSLIWCTGLSLGGFFLGEHWDSLRNWMRPFDPVIIALVVLLIAWYIWRHVKRLRNHSS